ncbi:MAG: MMPL family transporter [Nocardioides sp.]
MSPPGLSQKSTLYRLGGFAAGNPWRVLAGWAVVIALVVGLWAAFGEGTSDDITIPGMPSQQALDLLEERFPEQAGGRAVAVFATSDGTMSDSPNAEAVRATLDRIGRLDGVAQVIDPFGPAASLLQSPDGTVAYAQILYDRGAREVTPEQIDDLFATGDPAREAGLEVGFGGQVVERTEPEQARTAELVGLAVAVAVLLIAFGSVIAMGAPLLGALLGVGVGMLLIGLLASVMDVMSVAPTMASMIGIAVGIDYALFVVTRHRQHLAFGHSASSSRSRSRPIRRGGR